MWTEIERKSIEGIIAKQEIIGWNDFEKAYKNRENEKIQVLEDTSNCGEMLQVVQRQEKIWYLQSRYNAKKAAADWAEQFPDTNNENVVFLILGLGNGEHIRQLLQRNKDCKSIVYEPSAEIFWDAIQKPLVAQLLNLPNVYICVQGICENLLQICLETFLSYANYRMAYYCALPNYDTIFEDEYAFMKKKYLYEIKRILFNRNTEIFFSKEMLYNALQLSGDAIAQYSIMQLEDIVHKKGLDDMAAVLVAAGPSLDKNIEKLKAIKDSVFIMAVDTALNTVLKHGIIPDMTITVDGHKPLVLFEDERVKKIPIAVSVHSNEMVIKRSEAMRFYELSPEEFLAEVYRQLEKEVQGLPTGGSVANNALALLTLMGFQTVIFMGLDLAYPGGKQHTYDAYHKDEALLNEVKYFTVQDIYGNMVLTEANMHLYLKWFESYIAVKKNLRFIDATEGGALIHGTEIMTMEQVQQEIPSKTYKKQVIFKEIKPYLSKEEQQKAKELLLCLPEQLKEAEKRMRDGLKLYEKMDALNRKSNGQSQRLTKMLGQASDLNEYMNEGMVFILLKYYAAETDYRVKGKVLYYDKNAEPYIQMKGIIENGTEILQGYLAGVKELQADLGIMLEEFRA